MLTKYPPSPYKDLEMITFIFFLMELHSYFGGGSQMESRGRAFCEPSGEPISQAVDTDIPGENYYTAFQDHLLLWLGLRFWK